MKVGVVGPRDPDSFADNVFDCLPDLEVEAHALGPADPRFGGRFGVATSLALRTSDRLATRLQRTLVDAVASLELDLVISVDAALRPATVAAMRDRGARVVLWFPDAVANFGRQLLLLAPYDRLFIKEPVVVPRLADLLGLPVSYLPEACNPRWHRPIGENGVEPFIVVAGNMYPSRVLLLNRLVADGVPIRVFGGPVAPWLAHQPALAAHTGRYISREEKARVFREAAGVLNNLHPAEFDGVNCRLFEAAGSGAAVLAEYRPVLPDLFDVDKELFAFRTYGELKEQIRTLLDGPAAGVTKGDLASKRAHLEHNYQVRLKTILEDSVS